MPTFNYTAEDLSGAGAPIIALTAGVNYTFELSSSNNTSAINNNLASAAYFTIEQVGAPYGSSDPTNAIGTYSSFDWDFANLITSSYISSVVVDTRLAVGFGVGDGTYQFTPAENIAESSSMLRATGGLGLNLSF